jgi:hypothetical protein
MIAKGSTLELRRVPTTQIYLGSNASAQGMDTLSYFVAALNEGWDLTPVHLRTGRDVIPGMYRLEDGRKRFCAHLMAGEAHILALVENRL